MNRLAMHEAEYAEFAVLRPFLDRTEVERVERLRIERDKGAAYNSYGHDLFAAIRRGYRRKARASILEAQAYLSKAGWSERTHFPGALSVLIEVAAADGKSAEDIRRELQIALNRNDALSIERAVERAQKETTP